MTSPVDKSSPPVVVPIVIVVVIVVVCTVITGFYLFRTRKWPFHHIASKAPSGTYKQVAEQVGKRTDLEAGSGTPSGRGKNGGGRNSFSHGRSKSEAGLIPLSLSTTKSIITSSPSSDHLAHEQTLGDDPTPSRVTTPRPRSSSFSYFKSSALPPTSAPVQAQGGYQPSMISPPEPALTNPFSTPHSQKSSRDALSDPRRLSFPAHNSASGEQDTDWQDYGTPESDSSDPFASPHIRNYDADDGRTVVNKGSFEMKRKTVSTQNRSESFSSLKGSVYSLSGDDSDGSDVELAVQKRTKGRKKGGLVNEEEELA